MIKPEKEFNIYNIKEERKDEDVNKNPERSFDKSICEKEGERIVLVSTREVGYSQFTRFLPRTAVGLHYISALLRQQNYNVEIVNQTNDGLSDKEVKQKIKEINPKYVFLNQFFNTREKIKDIISDMSNEAIIVIGGHDATFYSKRLEEEGGLDKEYKKIDYIVQGEADNLNIKSMTKQERPQILKNLNKRINNLDDLPVLQHDDYSGDVGFLSTSRGCYKEGCDICTTPPFYPDGRKERSVVHVVKEIENLRKSGKKFIFICDDNFLGFNKENLDRGNQIIEKCREAGLKVMIMTTKEQILRAKEEKYLLDWKGVVFRCFIGIESGGEHVKEKIGKITNSINHAEKSKKAIDSLYENGIALFVGWINFKPDSTFEELELDAKFLFENGAECASFTNLCQSLRLYEGTKVYKKHKHRNIKIIKNEFDYDFDVPEVGELYRFLMFNARNKVTDQLDNLVYEITDYIYINQLQDDKLGAKYWDLKNSLNEYNYRFFINCLNNYKEGKENKEIDLNNFSEFLKNYTLKFQELKKEIIEVAEYK